MKNVLITGVSGGLGSAIARTMTGAGWNVIGLDCDPSDDLPGNASGNMTFILTDLTDQDAVLNAFREVSEKTSHLE